MSVLTAEDNLIGLRTLRKRLENWDDETVPAHDGATAWQALLERQGRDCVVTAGQGGEPVQERQNA